VSPAPASRQPLSLIGVPAENDSILGNRVITLGMRGRDVEQLLLLLVRHSLLRADKIPPESVYNADVESVIKNYQSSKGLKPDGKVDFRTVILLKAQ
jgi:murein L,D-transpeptidase YcbB/YkuD